jgi:hypothetical protein
MFLKLLLNNGRYESFSIRKYLPITEMGMKFLHIPLRRGVDSGNDGLRSFGYGIILVLADFVHIAPQAGLAGRTKIGKRSFFCMGAMVAEKIVIGDDVVVGANSVVLKNVLTGSKILGVYH